MWIIDTRDPWSPPVEVPDDAIKKSPMGLVEWTDTAGVARSAQKFFLVQFETEHAAWEYLLNHAEHKRIEYNALKRRARKGLKQCTSAN